MKVITEYEDFVIILISFYITVQGYEILCHVSQVTILCFMRKKIHHYKIEVAISFILLCEL